jgi:hypothetical protein
LAKRRFRSDWPNSLVWRAVGCVLQARAPSSRTGFTRNLENAVSLGFANDVKIPQRVTRAPLSRTEHAYELFLSN